MARIFPFPAVTSTERPQRHAGEQAAASGELVAMRHIDLDTVVETMHFLRDIGRSHLLDSFNRGAAQPEAEVPAKAPRRGRRKQTT